MTGKTTGRLQALVSHHGRILAGILLLLSPAACGGQGADGWIESGSAEITHGNVQNPTAYPVGSTDDFCSVSMIAPDVGLTTRDCASRSKTVEINGKRTSIRVQRNMVLSASKSSRMINTVIVAVQLGRAVSQHSGLGIDKKPLKLGEIVTCFGHSGGKLRSGLFEVKDFYNGHYVVRGRPNGTNSGLYEVSPEDVGGYCQRDGGNEITGILVTPTSQNVAWLESAHKLTDGHRDMRYAALAARQGVAIRLLDAHQQRFLTAPLNTVGYEAVARHSDDRPQAFYLDQVTKPPGGGTEWYRLVDVATGQCATATGGAPALVQSPCNPAATTQMFLLSYKNLNGQGYYRLNYRSKVVDANGPGNDLVSLNPPSEAASQWWTMWLTRM